MTQKHKTIHIVGAGVSGLIAARVLENNGFSPVILEKTDRPGGRVKTDLIEGYQLDHGFQVLLTAYPSVKKFIDLDALDIQKFVPGAAIFKEGKQIVIGDPLRDPSLLLSTVFSGIGTFSDKIKTLRLNTTLKQKTLSEIFAEDEKTTMAYLMDFGFSHQIIDEFFKPFFSGIFLEANLDTSSRMFEFIYKMFGEGYAVLPKSGIEAIPKQLAKGLSGTTFLFNTAVSSVKDGEIQLSDGTRIKSDYTILATDATKLIPNLRGQSTQWKSCDTLYFTAKTRIIKRPLIGLITNSEALINNIFYHTSVEMAHKRDGELLSVTVVKKHDLSEEDLIDRVKRELKDHCGIDAINFLKRYSIAMALPDLKGVQYESAASESRLSSGVFLAGDVQLNGSLNAAMISGERAALGLVQTLNDSKVS